MLDLGCGPGRPVAQHMVEQGLRVTGVDASPTMISLSRERLPDHEWIVADMRGLVLGRRFDGILAWDVLDYLDRNAALALATALTQLLRPDGALLGFFSTTESKQAVYTKYVVVDPQHLRYRAYPASRPRQRALLTGDIIRMFKGLRVSDSFLMKSNVREMLFRKNPA